MRRLGQLVAAVLLRLIAVLVHALMEIEERLTPEDAAPAPPCRTVAPEVWADDEPSGPRRVLVDRPGVCRAMPRPSQRPADGSPEECRYMAVAIVSAATPLALTPWLTHPDRPARGRGELAVTWGRA